VALLGGKGMTEARVVTAPTVTKLPPGSEGAVLVTGSHGGLYPGHLAVAAGVRAVIFHDAGVGRGEAGVASLPLLEGLGIAAAAVCHETARVGDTADMLLRGRISRANAQARAVGVAEGMACAQAAERLRQAEWCRAVLPAFAELRTVLHPEGAVRPLVLIDSASLVDRAADAGAVVVTGSHGGLIGGDPAMALQVDGYAAAYNDAGIGIEHAGIGRLAALDSRGIAAITVAAFSARIGEARSTLEDGIVSAANETARRMGARVDEPAAALLMAWTRKPR
jgi:hypothetical protein